MIKNPFCMPRLKASNTATKSNRRLSPISLVDRLREAVFRLIMLSALSKGDDNRRSSTSSSSQPSDHYYYPSNEPHHSEAVADCIEFIKKSATTGGGEGRDSTAGGYADDVIPLHVM